MVRRGSLAPRPLDVELIDFAIKEDPTLVSVRNRLRSHRNVDWSALDEYSISFDFDAKLLTTRAEDERLRH